MIHFSVTVDELNRIVRALNFLSRAEKVILHTGRESPATRDLRQHVKRVRKTQAVESKRTSMPSIEEIQTREGIELCQRIS